MVSELVHIFLALTMWKDFLTPAERTAGNLKRSNFENNKHSSHIVVVVVIREHI